MFLKFLSTHAECYVISDETGKAQIPASPAAVRNVRSWQAETYPLLWEFNKHEECKLDELLLAANTNF